MSSHAKKSLKFWFALVGISIVCLIGNFAFSSLSKNSTSSNAVADLGSEITISTAAELKSHIENYDVTRQNARFIITADINMNDLDASERVIDRTIGTEVLPFTGSFDGQGYTISNLSFDLSDSRNDATNKYIGLFGVTSGAVVKNVSIAGTTTFRVGECENVHAGVVAGMASQTKFQYVQNTSSVVFADDIFNHNVDFGTFAGILKDGSSVSYSISRAASITSIDLDSATTKIDNVGGFVGHINSATLNFIVAKSAFDVRVESSFRGTISLGGVAGVVQQSTSEIFDAIVENNFNVENSLINPNVSINVGEVVGLISNPAPKNGNISYTYYKTTTTYEVFGNSGYYAYKNPILKDYISALDSVPSNASQVNEKTWNSDFGGEWDFDSVWYFNTGTIYLQCTYGDFTLNLGTNLTSGNILENKQENFKNKYRYGNSAQIVFGFSSVDDGEDVVEMKDFYTLSKFTKDAQEVASFIQTEDGYKLSTDISSQNVNYSLETDSNGNFVLTIKNINMKTSGTFDVTVDQKKFTVNITSKLYSSDDKFESDSPAYVYQATGAQENTELSLQLGYDDVINLNRRLKNNKSPYSPVGWFLEGEDEDISISTSSTLSIRFGHGLYSGDMNIYAKYKNDACIVTFILDEGIKQVDLFSGDEVIDKTNTSYPISKTESSMKIEIYVKENYSFDAEDFIKSLDTYKSSDTTVSFCVWNNEDSDGKYYLFTLNMTTLKDENIVNGLNIDIKTTKEKTSQNSVIWYIVGGVGGGLVLVGVIILIIVLRRRNNFGGGSKSGSSFNKKNYKDMYY